MIRIGISSVCYRNAKAETIIDSARAAGLGGIEWSADTHAPHGDSRKAEILMMATLRAGLTVSAYGSFYRLGMNESGGASFETVLQTARHLQAPVIRIWAATDPERYKSLRKKKSLSGAAREMTRDQTAGIETLISQARGLADAAGKFGITLCMEPHDSSLVHDYGMLETLVVGTGHPFFKACWTPMNTLDFSAIHASVERLAPLVSLTHFRAELPLLETETIPQESPCLAMLSRMAEKERGSNLDSWALIEYVEDDSPQTLAENARRLLDRIRPVTR